MQDSRWSASCAKVAAFVRKEALFSAGDRVLVGVSGGIDSVFLWNVLCALSASLEIETLIAVYLDHGLRPAQTGEEAAWVRALAAQHGREAVVAYLAIPVVGASLQARARVARQTCLERLAEEHRCTRIALGHHRDDQAETLLQRFLRGTGPRGLAGIWPQRERWVRPLLCLARTEIQAVFEEQRWTWCEDPTNQKTDYQRNQIRHHLLPMLESTYNPQFRTHLAHLAWRVRQDEMFFAEQIEALWKVPLCVARGGNLCLSLSALQTLPQALSWRCLQRAIWEVYLLTIPEEQITHLLHLATATPRSTASQASLPSPFQVFCTQKSLWFLRTDALPADLSSLSFALDAPVDLDIMPSPLQTPWGLVSWKKTAQARTPSAAEDAVFLEDAEGAEDAVFLEDAEGAEDAVFLKSGVLSESDVISEDAEDGEEWSIHLPRLAEKGGGWCLRTRKAGDKVRLRGGHRTLKRWLIDQQVPVFLRDVWPVLAYERGIVGLPGLALSVGEEEAGDCFRLVLRPAPWLVSLRDLFFVSEDRHVVDLCWPLLDG